MELIAATGLQSSRDSNMWDVQGKPLALPERFELEPARVLYEYDGPRIFTCADPAGNYCLAYLCANDRTKQRFLLVPFDDNLEQQLTTGQISLRDAMNRPGARIIDFGNDWHGLAMWEVAIGDVPSDVLPRPGVMLWANLPATRNGATPAATGNLASPPAG
jgi:hypothetical protein